MYIYYPGHVPYLLQLVEVVRVSLVSCLGTGEGGSLPATRRSFRKLSLFFPHHRAVLCYAVLSLVVAVVRVGPWISNHLTQRRRVPKLPKTA